MMKGQDLVLRILRSSTNQVVSASIVLLMLLCMALISCFILYTVHSEVIYLLQASTYYINTHTSHHLQSFNTSMIDWSAGLTSAHSAGSEYTSALFQATRGIFGASLKLAVFYGSYVWMTHALFGLEIVFVPALLAAVFSLVPVVGVYWSSVPGFLVLWLVDGRILRACGFMGLQILPTYVIDMAVYSEIEGGWHPYITGLAVAGGMYYFGLEGAIIGPLVICILKFTINLYDVLFNSMGNDTQQPEPEDAVSE
eukprot:sb/3468647/